MTTSPTRFELQEATITGIQAARWPGPFRMLPPYWTPSSVLGRERLDAILYPVHRGCGLAARAGYPSITVPAGFTIEGHSFGITYTGSA